MSDLTLPPIPYKQPITDARGSITYIWAKWFEQLFVRIGGNIAPSNSDIEDLQDQVESLQTSVAAQSTSISDVETEINGLKQGPIL